MKAFVYVKIVKDLFLTLHTDFKLLNITRSIQRKTTKKRNPKKLQFCKASVFISCLSLSKVRVLPRLKTFFGKGVLINKSSNSVQTT